MNILNVSNNFLKNLLKEVKGHEMVSGSLLLFYVLSNIKLPHIISKLVNTLIGKMSVLLIGLYLFMHLKNALGFLCVIACVELVRRSMEATSPIVGYLAPGDAQDKRKAEKRVFKKTLEEEVVSRMTPLVKAPENLLSNYKPVLNDTHQATHL